jgi:hypothetical protein
VPSVTLDTNIYVSALVYGGVPLRLLHLAIDGDLEVAISQRLHEASRGSPAIRIDAYEHTGADRMRLVMRKGLAP